MYPRSDYFDSQSDAWKIAYLSGLLNSERETIHRITGHWLNALDRVKESESK